VSTRTIVTSQPDVACDICERRLLRGEQPDMFIAAGRRRTVCELCAPRAAQEGWLRESDGEALALPALRPRRGRSLIERILQVGRPAADEGPTRRSRSRGASYELLDADVAAPSVETGGEGSPDPAPRGAENASAASMGTAVDRAPGGAGGSYLHDAVDVFNASEFPRRLSGLARSLGTPEITVRSAEHLASVVRIVVGWELCWYRYEVDLSEGPCEARLLDQGSELDQLEREDRRGNARVDDAGLISI
jgi:hypothetical protein